MNEVRPLLSTTYLSKIGNWAQEINAPTPTQTARVVLETKLIPFLFHTHFVSLTDWKDSDVADPENLAVELFRVLSVSGPVHADQYVGEWKETSSRYVITFTFPEPETVHQAYRIILEELKETGEKHCFLVEKATSGGKAMLCEVDADLEIYVIGLCDEKGNYSGLSVRR